MKTLIIGGVAAGASAATRLRRLDETAEIVLLERGEFVSFANCALPYRLGGIVSNREALSVVSPNLLRTRFRIDVRINSEAVEIAPATKSVKIREKSGREYVEKYDRLLLATGSTPIRQNVPGGNDPRISPLWTIPDSDEIFRRIESGARRALVVGAGAIGLETAENLRSKGLAVTIVARSQVVKTIDRETSRPVLDELATLGIRVELGRQITAFEPSENAITAVLDDGRRLEIDFVLVGVGVRPNSELAIAAGLTTEKHGHIVVDRQMKTSDDSIFAAGDVVEVDELTLGGKTAIALAGPANKQGRIAANSIFAAESANEFDGDFNALPLDSLKRFAEKSKYPGTLGASILKIGTLNVGSVGWTEKNLKAAHIPFRKVYLNPSSNAGFYPGGTPIFIKLIFAPTDGKILGAQFVGRRGVDKRTDVVATAMRFGATVFDLSTLELAYAPPFNAAKDPVNDAGTVAANVLTGQSRVVYPDEIPTDALLLDVRTREEYELTTIPDAVNIPLDELRERLGELDRTQKIVVFCQVGKRGYVAERILRANEFDVANLSGGFTAWRYFNAPLPDFPESMPAETLLKSEEITRLKTLKNAAIIDSDDETPIELNVRALSCPGPIVRLRKTFDSLAPGARLRLLAAATFEIGLKSWTRSTDVSIVRFSKNAETLDALLQKSKAEGSVNTKEESMLNDDYCSTCAPLSATSKDSITSPQKTHLENNGPKPRKTAALVLFSDDLDKATAAMIMACGAAASGLETSVFFTFWGLSAIRKNPAPRVRKNLMAKIFGAFLPLGATKLKLSKMNFGGVGKIAMNRAMRAQNVPSLSELIEQAKELGVRFIACETAMKVMGITESELVGVDEVAGVGRFVELAKDAGPTLFV